MRKNHDFSKASKNPCTKRLKKQITIRLESEVIHSFKTLSAETGIPYQNLINPYLRECAAESRRTSFNLKPEEKA